MEYVCVVVCSMIVVFLGSSNESSLALFGFLLRLLARKACVRATKYTYDTDNGLILRSCCGYFF